MKRFLLPLWTIFAVGYCEGLSSTTRKILVTGASGRTGQLVFEALLRDPRYDPLALVRSERSGKKLRKALPQTDLNQVIVCDVTTDLTENIPHALEGCDAMIICTSAVPTVSKRSLLINLLKIPFNLIRGKKAIDFRSLRFVWKNNGYPEKVDYQGQVAQIDLARKLKMDQVIVVSSMGGTDPSNFLNSVGKRPDGTGNGDILLWKRKAEKYLVESGLDYTIIHPGGLVDTPAGQQEFVIDVDDSLMQRKSRSISRADVANLCVAALSVAKGRKVSLDCITQPTEGTTKSAEESLSEYLQSAKVYNYAL
jgi:uncharacterized protein YbjT (DUF2867 family)